jgi:hypothetical protein
VPRNPSPTLPTQLPNNFQPVDLYGTDVSTVPSLDVGWKLTHGQTVLAQRLLRRFTTPRGFLRWYPNDGLDLRSFLSKGMTNRDVAALKGLLEKEGKKDEQVDDCTAIVSWDQAAETLNMSISVAPSLGPTFTFTATATSLDVTLISVGLSSP